MRPGTGSATSIDQTLLPAALCRPVSHVDVSYTPPPGPGIYDLTVV